MTSIVVLSSLPNIPSMAELLTNLAREFTLTNLVALLVYAAAVTFVSVVAIRRERRNQRRNRIVIVSGLERVGSENNRLLE